ncbi:hypothetical protein PMIN06_010827 [Paraphaeosphaeria minitans]
MKKCNKDHHDCDNVGGGKGWMNVCTIVRCEMVTSMSLLSPLSKLGTKLMSSVARSVGLREEGLFVLARSASTSSVTSFTSRTVVMPVISLMLYCLSTTADDVCLN